MRARLIKGEELAQQSGRGTMRQNGHGQLEAQAQALTGIAAIQAEVEARMTTSMRQKRVQARENFNDLFARLSQR